MGKRSRDSTRRVPPELAAVVSGVLRALSLCVPVAGLDVPAALAQQFAPAVLVADIPSQPLGDALAVFAKQTGLQLVYVSGVIDGQRSHAVSAGLAANEALARMLEGTGLKFEYLTPRSIRILAAIVTPLRENTTRISAGDELQEVIVTANLREENVQDVPMTIQVLTGATLASLNATTFDDFVKYLPNVSTASETEIRCAASAPRVLKSPLSMRSKRTLVVWGTMASPGARPLSINCASQAL